MTANLMHLSSESKVWQKERLALAQTMQSPMIFVIHTISLLVRSCQFINPTQAANPSAAESDADSTAAASTTSNATAAAAPATAIEGSLYNGIVDPATGAQKGHSLDKDELDLLINYIANRVWWRSSAQELPMVRNAVADMFAYIATDNREFSHVQIQEIFKVLAVSNFMVVKRYERPLLILVRINDPFQRERITKILNNLYEVFRKNTMYWKFCDSLIEMTYKLAKRCKPFAVEMSKSKNLINMIATMTRENPSFPYN